MIYDVRHNRLVAARMRDGRRWVTTYRKRACEVAIEEAERRSFLSSFLFAVSQSVALLAGRPASLSVVGGVR